jgi:hypothetical protein
MMDFDCLQLDVNTILNGQRGLRWNMFHLEEAYPLDPQGPIGQKPIEVSLESAKSGLWAWLRRVLGFVHDLTTDIDRLQFAVDANANLLDAQQAAVDTGFEFLARRRQHRQRAIDIDGEESDLEEFDLDLGRSLHSWLYSDYTFGSHHSSLPSTTLC